MDHTFHFFSSFSMVCATGERAKQDNNLPVAKDQDMAGTEIQNNKTVDLNN